MSNDLIRRQDAIDALEEQLDYLRMLNKNENPTAEGKWYGINWARNTITDLPSAEKAYQALEKSPGEWARHDEWRGGEYIGGFYHVNCPCEDGYYSKWRTNFCPNCGLPMQKGDAK